MHELHKPWSLLVLLHQGFASLWPQKSRRMTHAQSMSRFWIKNWSHRWTSGCFFKTNLFQNYLWRKTRWEIPQATLWLLILMVRICQSSKLKDQGEKRHISPRLTGPVSKISWTASGKFNFSPSSQSASTFGFWFGDVLGVLWENIKSWVNQLFFSDQRKKTLFSDQALLKFGSFIGYVL